VGNMPREEDNIKKEAGNSEVRRGGLHIKKASWERALDSKDCIFRGGGKDKAAIERRAAPRSRKGQGGAKPGLIL